MGYYTLETAVSDRYAEYYGGGARDVVWETDNTMSRAKVISFEPAGRKRSQSEPASSEKPPGKKRASGEKPAKAPVEPVNGNLLQNALDAVRALAVGRPRLTVDECVEAVLALESAEIAEFQTKLMKKVLK